MPNRPPPESDWERDDADEPVPDAVLALMLELGGSAEPVGGGLRHPTFRVADMAVRVTGEGAGEAALLEQVRGLVPVPAVVRVTPQALVTRWVGGERWADRLAREASAYRTAFEVGRAVAALHLATRMHPRAGLLGGPSFDLGEAWADLVTRAADHPLLAAVRDRLLGVVRENQARISALGPPFSLLHGDCKPTNVRVGEDGRLLALLDWEFAWVGSPWSDLGQLVRWADRYPVDFVPGLVDGYEPEDPDWRELGALLDLINLAQFLLGPERPSVQRDAAQRVARTLE